MPWAIVGLDGATVVRQHIGGVPQYRFGGAGGPVIDRDFDRPPLFAGERAVDDLHDLGAVFNRKRMSSDCPSLLCGDPGQVFKNARLKRVMTKFVSQTMMGALAYEMRLSR